MYPGLVVDRAAEPPTTAGLSAGDGQISPSPSRNCRNPSPGQRACRHRVGPRGL